LLSSRAIARLSDAEPSARRQPARRSTRGGRSLSDLNYADLFGKRYPAEAAALVTTIHGVMGNRQLGPAAALEAVEQATATDRADLLRRLTKEMLVDPARRIELDELVSQEVRRVLAAIQDPTRVAGPLGGTANEQFVRVATEAQELWELTKPFCASLQVAARWGTPDMIAPWANGLQSFVQAALKVEGGVSALLELRHLPGVVSLTTAAVAAGSARRWDNVKALVADPRVRGRHDPKPQALLDATDPWAPFDHDGWTAGALARSLLENIPLDQALDDLVQKRAGKYHTPVAEWIHALLRPVFAEQWPDDDAYTTEYERAEVVLGVLAQDAVNMRLAADADGRGYGQSRWFGRSTWRAAHYHGNAVDDLQHELTTEGSLWGPLRVDLFGGDPDRAQAALDKYSELFAQIARSRMF
jgi:hypothetical protein